MATTYAATINNALVFGNVRVMDISFVGTGTYTSGGDAITPATCGLDVIIAFHPMLDPSAGAETNGVAVLSYNTSNNKLQLWTQQTANSTSLMVEFGGTTVTGLGFRALVYGF